MWHMLKTEEVVSRLQTSTKMGLADNEITIRKEKYGANKLQEKKKENIVIKFIKQFNDNNFNNSLNYFGIHIIYARRK